MPLHEEIEKRCKAFLDDVDNGKLISPACKRTASDAGSDEQSILDHTRLEAFRYLLSVPRREFVLLADPAQQAALLDGYLRQLPHEQTVIEFTGTTSADLAIAVIAGFNWLVYCATLAGADPRKFFGVLRNFRKVVSSAQNWWMEEGRSSVVPTCCRPVRSRRCSSIWFGPTTRGWRPRSPPRGWPTVEWLGRLALWGQWET